MEKVFNRYSIILILIALIIAGIFAFLFLQRQDTNKIPSRGVFVYNFDRTGIKNL